jgi:hypothetical protein
VRKKLSIFSIIIVGSLILSCASVRTSTNYYTPILTDLKTENYPAAISKIDLARKNSDYTKKERVLFYLDKGITQYYNDEHDKSIQNFSTAEKYMEELFTKSLSKAALSWVLNDNAMDYYGEVYEDLYINIFQALNYLNLKNFEDAYVEINRVNDKLRELNLKYENLIDNLNSSDDAKVKIEKAPDNLTSDVLAHYLSYLLYRADHEPDNSRISFEKMIQTWDLHSDIYSQAKPVTLREPPRLRGTYLNVIAFTGFAPYKKSVGAKITTYEDAIGISSVEAPIPVPNIPFPGSKPGYHFKFAFPVIETKPSSIDRIEIVIDGKNAGTLELLEDMGKIAEKTFNAKRTITYVKTLVRTVVKGLAAAEAKKKLKKETKANTFWTSVMNAAVDMGVDATENPDLRCWRIMPQYCYIGEYRIDPGVHKIEVRFLTKTNLLVRSKVFPNFNVGGKLNLLDVVSIN